MSMQRLCIRILACLFVVTSLSACDRSVDLRLKAQPGDKRVFNVTNALKTTASMGQMGIPAIEDSSRHTFTYQIEEVNEIGNVTAKVSCDFAAVAGGGQMSAILKMMGQGNPVAEAGPVELTVELGPDGTVNSVTGMTEPAEKVIAAIAESAREQVAAQSAQIAAQFGPTAAAVMGQMDGLVDKMARELDKVMSNQAAKGQLALLTDVLPSEKVSVGSSWQEDWDLGGLPVALAGTCTVTARGDGLMSISYRGDVSPNSQQGGLAMGDVQGTVTGTIQVEEGTGWIRSASFEVSVKGGGSGMSSTTEGTIYIESTAHQTV